MKNFFQRPKSENYTKDFLPTIKKVLNINNLDIIKKSKILSLYTPQNERDFLAYRFDLLQEWMLRNREYTKQYVVALDDMIEKLYLVNELNSFEQQYIKNINAVVFAKNRNLKQLIVDFSINKNEWVFYRYELDLFRQNHNNKIRVTEEPEMYITTQRIIISKNMETISLYYNNIKSILYARSKFSFILKDDRECIIESENNRAIYESLNRVLAREKIKFS